MYCQNLDHEPFMKLYFALISIYSMPFFKMHIILMQTFFLALENDFWNGLVVLLFYVHGKHLRSCRDGQLT